jgi:hypothetical protein
MRSYTVVICLLFGFVGQATASYTELQQSLEQENYADAIRFGEAILKDAPDHTRAAFLTAYAYQQSGRLEKAIVLYEKLIDEHPDLPEPLNNLAMIYLSQGDYDRASQMLVQAIHTHSSYATAYDNLSRIYKGIASEAYRRAVNESNEPDKYTHKIELAAITELDSLPPEPPEPEIEEEPPAVAKVTAEKVDPDRLLIEQVEGWARAWSDKDFDAYTGYYDSEFRGNLPTHQAWIDYRRKRVVRPGDIEVEVSNIKIDWRGENRVLLDFEQAFDSPTYSDRVVKRLVFSRRDSQWKITEEWVLSVL